MKPKRIARWSAGAISLALVVAALGAYWTSDNDCARETHPRGDSMIAAIACDYGPPDVLRLEHVEKCAPTDDQLLVRVRAAALNPGDLHRLRGTPYVARLSLGLRKPAVIRLGADFAGTVVAVGGKVTRFKPGDDVFGGRTGALAEYLCVSEGRAVAPMPSNLTFEQAAGIAVAGTTALQGLRDEGKVRRGQKVLVNGASGGVGTFAVQIAKSLGADATGVCSTRNLELVRSIGAGRVVDYTREDFTKRGDRYDVILDNVGNHSLLDLRRLLDPGGRYVMVSGPKGRWVDPLPRAFRARVLSWFVEEDLGMFIAKLNGDDLNALRELVQAGKVTPVVDRRYPLAEVAAAMRYLEEGHARGKVVIVLE